MSKSQLPLFPLNVVLFPGGRLPLRIFEPRYLDMVTNCIKTDMTFGVVCVVSNDESLEARSELAFSSIGTIARITKFDVPQAGLMFINCVGQNRFHINSASQKQDGLWVGEVEPVADDIPFRLPPDLQGASDGLKNLIIALEARGIPDAELPLLKPYQLDDCSWVANRWCELLDIPLKQKQTLLELDSPLLRLELVNDMISL